MSDMDEIRQTRFSAGVQELFYLIDELPVGLVILDDVGTVVRASPLAVSHLGRQVEEVVGGDLFAELLPELRSHGVGEAYRRGILTGQLDDTREIQIDTPSGPRVCVVTLRRVPTAVGVFGVALIEDRTALATEEKRRKRAESLASVGELAASLAHEVNNPLASIKSLAQLLARGEVSDEQRHALELIISETGRIGHAVESVVAFARQQGASGREPLILSELVERVIEVRRYSLETAGIEVRMDLDASISPVMGEPGALQQVILNLVSRSEADLGTKEGERLLIVRTKETSEGVVLYVVDNGPGIPRAELPYLFDTRRGSHNLELATSARIVRDHGGYILAESEPGRGAAFFVRLPRAGSPPLSAPAGAPAPPAPSPARTLRVLVADDEPTLRLAITLFLRRRGHEVTQAADAYEAFELASSQDFDVALVDARMPGDGLALLEKLEALPSLAGRTALMTGDLGRARTTQGIPTGRPYLVKPFDMNDAVNLIEKLGEPSPL